MSAKDAMNINTPRAGQLLTCVVTVFLLVHCTVESAGQRTGSSIIEMDADLLYQNSISQWVSLTSDGISPLLHTLVEDDAPGHGYASQGGGGAETIKGDVILKKVLVLDEAPRDTAFLVALFYPLEPPEPNSGAQIRFSVNGNLLDYALQHFWTKVPVPPEFLQAGPNTITVQTKDSSTAFTTYLSVDENFKLGSDTRTHHPNRSAKSTDGGRSWDDQNLGNGNDLDGEYPIRLLLQQPPETPWVRTSVIDLAVGAAEQGIKLPATDIQATIQVIGSGKAWSGVIVFRSGANPYVDGGWSDWTPVLSGHEQDVTSRYGQYELRFAANAKDNTLNGIRIMTSYRQPKHRSTSFWKVNELTNHSRISSSFQFAYENPRHPQLQELRQHYQLDDVVAGAQTELDTFRTLSSWVAGQWDWYLLPPDREIKTWNALDILDPGPSGDARGGYCLHYAITYMQALQSFGFPARIVNANYSIWSGHEMTEVWSRELGKWILMDANFDIHFLDAATGIPMNALELHDHFLAHYYPGGEAIDRNDWSRRAFMERTERVGKPDDIIGVVGGGARGGTLTKYEWWRPPLELSPYCGGFGFLNTGYFRILPRSDFLSHPTPIPVNHGRTHWGWDGYYCWTDDQTPPSQEHKIFTSRPADLYWNLNQVDFTLTRLDSNLVRVDFSSNLSPGAVIQLSVDDEIQTPKANTAFWELKTGVNTLRLWVRDVFGRPGQVSSAKIELE